MDLCNYRLLCVLSTSLLLCLGVLRGSLHGSWSLCCLHPIHNPPSQPARLWELFAELSTIPRMSKQEGAVLAWLKEWAGARGLEYSQVCVSHQEGGMKGARDLCMGRASKWGA